MACASLMPEGPCLEKALGRAVAQILPLLEKKEDDRMENVEIARILNEYADLLEIHEDNPFRVRSYRKAAQTVAGLSRPVAQLIAAGGGLTRVPRVGTRI